MPDTRLAGLASNFRDQLVIDRYSSVLAQLSLRRQVSLASSGSYDAEIWNVFRTLVQIDPSRWLSRSLAICKLRMFLEPEALKAGVGISLWKRIKPPPERLEWLRKRALRGEMRPPVGRKRKGRIIPLSELRAEMKAKARRKLPLEEPVEVDVIIKARGAVLFVEIPGYDESPDQPAVSDRDRSHLLRLIDAGLSYTEARSRAQRRPIRFGLLVLPRDPDGVAAWSKSVRRVAVSPTRLKRSLPHRSRGFDPSSILQGIGIGQWSSMKSLLTELHRQTDDEFEEALLDRLLRPNRPRKLSVGSSKH